MSHILVLGHGPATHRLLRGLRRHGHDGTVTVLSAEYRPVQHRPLLTTVLQGRLEADMLCPEPEPGARVLTGAVATAVDTARRVVHARQGDTVTAHPYDVLVLACGARPVIPPLPGASDRTGRLAPGVTTLREVTDCDRIQGTAVTVLGGGPLGVETASALALRGTVTTLVCSGPHPLHERLGGTGAALLTARLREAGVDVLGGRRAVRREPGRLLLDDGTEAAADSLVLCTGVEPEVRLARAAGIRVHHGIVVDDALRSSDSRVYAIGDCAEHAGRTVAGHESALAQADTLAAVLTGREVTHRPTPAVLRLRTHAVDVACVGPLAAFRRSGIRTVGLFDPVGRRYARLALDGDRIAAAVLLGLPDAIATVSHLHRRGLPVPSDRLSLLLGIRSHFPPAEDDDRTDSMVCLCNHVSQRQLAGAWELGARTVPALVRATRATTGCGSCTERVETLCAGWTDASGRELEPTP
ncbi:FAD-dependent oxidoreductase [Streptomyces hirsutus]|uniref:FAD-dependent oxidoreductase n=1 Tax=Streptomyces hirsutus TaxID=35620 RepID=A0ABZ1GDY5_9ACTN|nr:FAD-dependent oxidoreductase [Streptomyces hirsutus]WSD04351.1 FAD-dependent oxidoreductase [Streptomyces hirsutus]